MCSLFPGMFRRSLLDGVYTGIATVVKNSEEWKKRKHGCQDCLFWEVTKIIRHIPTTLIPPLESECRDALRWSIKHLVWRKPMPATKWYQMLNEIVVTTLLYQWIIQPLKHAAVLSVCVWDFMKQISSFGISLRSDVFLMTSTYA